MTITREYGFQGSEQHNYNKLFDFLNAFTDVIEFEVETAGDDVEIPHDLEAIPRQVFPVIIEGATTSFANVFPGSAAWTSKAIYLTASLPGKYYVVLRR